MSEPESQGRTDYLRSDDFFMATAYLASMRSKDPDTQVGACIVNEENVIVGIGHNMMPKDCDEFPWGRNVNDVKRNKYTYVVHAGPVAILNSNANMRGCTMYTTLFPSAETAKVVSLVGIKRVVYLSDKFRQSEDSKASKITFNNTNVKFEQFIPFNNNPITINFGDIIENSMF